jgi:hypothetical protein
LPDYSIAMRSARHGFVKGWSLSEPVSDSARCMNALVQMVTFA